MKSSTHGLFYLMLAAVYSEGNRKYDINRESQMTYGRDLAGVLSKFRRSPDYLKILERKRELLMEEYHDVAMMTFSFYREKLRKRVQEIIGIDLKAAMATEPPTTSTIAGLRFRQWRRQDGNDSEPDPAQQERIKRIDKYHKLSSSLSLQERNEFKNVGFQYIGDCLHAIIENMGGEMGPPEKTTTAQTTLLTPPSDSNEEEEEGNKIDKLWSSDPKRSAPPLIIRNLNTTDDEEDMNDEN